MDGPLKYVIRIKIGQFLHILFVGVPQTLTWNIEHFWNFKFQIPKNQDSATFGVIGLSYSLFFIIWHLTFPDLHIAKMGYLSYLLAVALWAGIFASTLLTLARFPHPHLVLGFWAAAVYCSITQLSLGLNLTLNPPWGQKRIFWISLLWFICWCHNGWAIYSIST
jgi:hypothetical protein